MTFPVKLESKVGSDGVLNLRVPLGVGEAGTDVLVTIQPAEAARGSSGQDHADWHQFVEETYGSCAGLGLERHDQGAFETREAIE